MKENMIAREGMRFIVPSLAVSVAAYLFSVYSLSALSLAFSVFCLFFFRNPQRASNEPDDRLLSPADGKIVGIQNMMEEEFTGSEATRVSIFMSLASVHVNRSPAEGRIVEVQHRSGRFALAWKAEVDRENERNYILLEREKERILVVQIAGFLARRITPYVAVNDEVKRGQPIGIIAFGSRVDIYIPKSYECMVQLHDMVKAGQTPLAKKRGSL